MKIWLTAPYDPDAIQEVDATFHPELRQGAFSYPWRGGTVTRYFSLEGRDWHRTKKAAAEIARQYRAQWLKETTEAAAKVAALPAIAA